MAQKRLTTKMSQTLRPENQVDTKSVAYKRMESVWAMIDDLMGGTKAMRRAKELWLPREPNESSDVYDLRLSRSVLFGALKDTIRKLSGKPFSRPITVTDIPGKLGLLAKDTDKCGTDLTTFAKNVFADGLAYGMVDILIDYPAVDPSATLADEREKGAQPIFIHVRSKDVVGWRTETLGNGELELTEVRIKEERVEAHGEYGDKAVNFIRVYRTDTWELWRQNPEDLNWSISESGSHSFNGVPLVTMYLGPRIAYREVEPPLEDLAWLNISHWQSSSDQKNILRFARCPLLFAAGFTEEQVKDGIVIGPTNMVSTTDSNAKLTHVEHTGKAIESGEKDISKIEDQMETMGSQPLVRKGGSSPTATGKLIDEAGRVQSELQAMVRKLEACLEQCYAVAGQWVSEKLPEKFSIDAYSDFSISTRATTDLDWLLKARAQGDLDHKTLIEEARRRGVFNDTVKSEDILAAIANEGPSPLPNDTIPGDSNG